LRKKVENKGVNIMYEKIISNEPVNNAPVCDEGARVKFKELQEKKRILAEDCLIKAEVIVSFLDGIESTPIEKREIDSLMSDMLSEYGTLMRLQDRLSFILDCLGA
jgi:hypothetical protein